MKQQTEEQRLKHLRDVVIYVIGMDSLEEEPKFKALGVTLNPPSRKRFMRLQDTGFTPDEDEMRRAIKAIVSDVTKGVTKH